MKRKTSPLAEKKASAFNAAAPRPKPARRKGKSAFLLDSGVAEAADAVASALPERAPAEETLFGGGSSGGGGASGSWEAPDPDSSALGDFVSAAGEMLSTAGSAIAEGASAAADAAGEVGGQVAETAGNILSGL